MIQNENKNEIIEAWDHPIQATEEKDLTKLLEVVASESNRLDVELDELYDNRLLGEATGNELEKIGNLVGVIRKTDESDEKLRKRIQGGFAAKASDTTYNDFASVVLSILETDKDGVTFVTPPDTDEKKTVQIQIDGALFDENPLTEDELIILLNGAVSVDARVTVSKTGTFAFDGDDVSLEGFNEGTWSVGVN